VSVRTWNRAVKGWAGWVALVLVIAGFLAVGATRDGGPQTQEDRIDELTKRVACPICDGESVFESRNNASEAIRNQVAELVAANDLGDNEIIAFIETRYGAEVLLVPRSSGLDALVWVLPAVAFVCGLAALVVVFRRWKREAGSMPDPTDDDRALVEAALADRAAHRSSGDWSSAPGDDGDST
jgi:cytochrome c-type biogenesis protein CcmH